MIKHYQKNSGFKIYHNNIMKFTANASIEKELIPFLLEGVAMKPEFNLSDGIHPNEEGTIIMSRTLEETIIKTYNKKN